MTLLGLLDQWEKEDWTLIGTAANSHFGRDIIMTNNENSP